MKTVRLSANKHAHLKFSTATHRALQSGIQQD